MDKKYKKYIGDGVYADFDGFAIVLTTEYGNGVENVIVLEPDVYASLVLFANDLKNNRESQ